jgi:hypothetical protein
MTDTWEGRMAAKAAVRREIREADELQELAWEEANDPHRDHHVHLDGTRTVCSCGEKEYGVTCVAFPGELTDMDPDEAYAWWMENVRCSVCGKRGVTDFGQDE